MKSIIAIIGVLLLSTAYADTQEALPANFFLDRGFQTETTQRGRGPGKGLERHFISRQELIDFLAQVMKVEYDKLKDARSSSFFSIRKRFDYGGYAVTIEESINLPQGDRAKGGAAKYSIYVFPRSDIPLHRATDSNERRNSKGQTTEK